MYKPSPLQFQVLTDGQQQKIFNTSLDILEKVGVEIFESNTLNLLKKNGAKADGNRVFLPNNMVKNALSKTPSGVTIYSREGEEKMQLTGTNSYFGNGSDCPNIRDPYSGQRRKATKEDVANLTRVCDALSNFDFVMPGAIPSDISSRVADVHQFEATVSNTTKPIVFTSLSQKGTEVIIELASIAAGGKENLHRKPFIIPYIEPTSPLRLSKEAAQKLLLCAGEGLPILFPPGPMSGASAPVTMAGTIALHIAENLLGVVITQMINKGTPLIIGGCSSEMDMKTMVSPYGGPTFNLVNAGISELCNYLDLPMFGTAGCSDSKLPDEQAVFESTLSCLTQPLTGANLIHDVGYIESGMTVSMEMLVINNEVIDAVRAILRGINTDKDHLAFDAIDKVGPGGNFLAQRHTLNHFKTEHWSPQLSNRKNYQKWEEEGRNIMKSNALDKVHSILEDYSPPQISTDKRERIDNLLNKTKIN